MFHVVSVWFLSQVFPPFVIQGSWQTVLWAGFTLSMLSLIAKPILKILFIPINLLTFGLGSWIVNVIVIYMLTMLVPSVQIRPWLFPETRWAGFVLPPIHFSYMLSLIATSLTMTFMLDALRSLTDS